MTDTPPPIAVAWIAGLTVTIAALMLLSLLTATAPAPTAASVQAPVPGQVAGDGAEAMT